MGRALLDHLVTGIGQRPCGGPHRLAALVAHRRDVVLLEGRHAQPGRGCGLETRAVYVRIAGQVGLGEDRQEQLEVLDVARHRADLRCELDADRVRGRGVALVRNDPASRADAGDPAEVARDANRSTVVRADAERAHAGGDRRGLAARGSARRAPVHVRVVSRAVDEVVRVVVDRELGDVGLAEQDRAGATQVADHDGVLCRDVALQQLRPIGAGHPSDLDGLLGRERHTMQRADVLVPGDERLFGGASFLERLLESRENQRVDLAVDLFGASYVRLDQLDGAHFSLQHGGRHLPCRPSQQLLHLRLLPLRNSVPSVP